MEKRNPGLYFVIAFTILCFLGCATTLPKPSEIVPPTPIPDNSGAYMCPYTQDGVVAPWCDKAINVSIGTTIGRTAGAYVGSKLLEQIPFVGGLLGSKAGEATGRALAIEAIGGWEYIKSTSDQSFNSAEDLAVWLYATKSDNEHYNDVCKATAEIYPEFKKCFDKAIASARTR